MNENQKFDELLINLDGLSPNPGNCIQMDYFIINNS
jgi:hypothetical protein